MEDALTVSFFGVTAVLLGLIGGGALGMFAIVDGVLGAAEFAGSEIVTRRQAKGLTPPPS